MAGRITFVVGAVLLVLSGGPLAATEPTRKPDLPAAQEIKISLPPAWNVVEKKKLPNGELRVYKREPLTTDKGKALVPNMVVYVERFATPVDPKAFLISKRLAFPFTRVTRVLTSEDIFGGYRTALGLYGTAYEKRVRTTYTRVLATAVFANSGLTVIINAPERVFPAMEKECFDFLRSIRIIDRPPGAAAPGAVK
ncbi:MAG TPA: hypothetical protein PLG31_05680 [Spirochaetota bacterium]|nr:hypothetical protein [Spirochaetota bacterium]